MKTRRLTFWEATSLMVGAGVGAGIMAVPYLAERVGLIGLALVLPIAWAASAFVHLMLAEVLIAAVIMALVLRIMMINPIVRLARAIGAIQPGTATLRQHRRPARPAHRDAALVRDDAVAGLRARQGRGRPAQRRVDAVAEDPVRERRPCRVRRRRSGGEADIGAITTVTP